MTPAIDPSSLCIDPAIWCCVPVYNNAATIADVARRCRAQIANVVIVDDGSTDADLRILLGGIDVQVIRHATNLGKGAALQSGFQYAADHGAMYLITLDGDGQHFPEDIPRFIADLAPDVMLIGYRNEVTGVMPRSSQFGREFSDFWIYVETGREVHDTQSGFRAYPLASVMALNLDCRHYNFEMEIITKALWAGLRAQTVLIRVLYPPRAERVSSFRAFVDNFRISILHARLVARQLLPIPHGRLSSSRLAGSLASRVEGHGHGMQACRLNEFVMGENSTPIGLAAAVGLSILLGILLWPYGIVVVAYLVIRLHLNKVAASLGIMLTMPPAVAGFCRLTGHWVLRNAERTRFEWFVGSHIVAFTMAAASTWVVYAIARRFHVHGPGPKHEHR